MSDIQVSGLVDAGTLKSVPKDLFDDRPIKYSRKRRCLWSVGGDGKNKGAKNSRVTWQLAPPEKAAKTRTPQPKKSNLPVKPAP